MHEQRQECSIFRPLFVCVCLFVCYYLYRQGWISWICTDPCNIQILATESSSPIYSSAAF